MPPPEDSDETALLLNRKDSPDEQLINWLQWAAENPDACLKYRFVSFGDYESASMDIEHVRKALDTASAKLDPRSMAYFFVSKWRIAASPDVYQAHDDYLFWVCLVLVLLPNLTRVMLLIPNEEWCPNIDVLWNFFAETAVLGLRMPQYGAFSQQTEYKSHLKVRCPMGLVHHMRIKNWGLENCDSQRALVGSFEPLFYLPSLVTLEGVMLDFRTEDLHLVEDCLSWQFHLETALDPANNDGFVNEFNPTRQRGHDARLSIMDRWKARSMVTSVAFWECVLLCDVLGDVINKLPQLESLNVHFAYEDDEHGEAPLPEMSEVSSVLRQVEAHNATTSAEANDELEPSVGPNLISVHFRPEVDWTTAELVADVGGLEVKKECGLCGSVDVWNI